MRTEGGHARGRRTCVRGAGMRKSSPREASPRALPLAGVNATLAERLQGRATYDLRTHAPCCTNGVTNFLFGKRTVSLSAWKRPGHTRDTQAAQGIGCAGHVPRASGTCPGQTQDVEPRRSRT